MGFLFLALPSYLMPATDPPTDRFPDNTIPGLLTLELWGPMFPSFWKEKLSMFARIALTALEVGALSGLFGRLARDTRLRDQVMYAMLGVGALMILAPFLYKFGVWS